jgi:integrase
MPAADIVICIGGHMTSSLAKIDPSDQQHFQLQPFFGPIAEDFATWCLGRGLPPPKIRWRLIRFRRLAYWFHCKRKQSPQDLSIDDITLAQRFYCHRVPQLTTAVTELGDFLKDRGALKPEQPLRKVKQCSWQRYRDLPIIGAVLDDYVRWCLDRGFAVQTISMHLDVFRRLLPWFLRRCKQSIGDISAHDLEGLRKFYRGRKLWYCASLRSLGNFLREQGRLKPEVNQPIRLGRAEKEIRQFEIHLHKDYVLANTTIRAHCFCIRLFLGFLGIDKNARALKDLKLAKIDGFVRRLAHRYSRRTMPQMIGMIRKFLRFEYLTGALRDPLYTQLDSVMIYREERLPHPLSWPELQKLLGSMDRSTPIGLRDFTMILLAASYGLRRSEVCAMTLDQIDWRSRILCMTQPKTGQCLRLPLTDEVAMTLVRYLRHGRPRTTSRHLFMRMQAPAGPIGRSGVTHCLERAIRTTGVKIQTKRFHALRYAFALRLLQEGVGLKHISEVLGHRSYNTTSVYLRLDVEDLRQVALPVPNPVKFTPPNITDYGLISGKGVPLSRRVRHPGSVTAPASVGFRSFLARPMRDFLSLQRALGRRYLSQEWILRNLDFFLTNQHPRGRAFTGAMCNEWIGNQADVFSTVRTSWLGMVRHFCIYLARSVPGTFIPDPRTFPKRQSYREPCLLSQNDISRLLAAAAQKPRPVRTPEHPLRQYTMRLAVLLLYCCGLRRAEVLNLRLEDIDHERLLLSINDSKFNKSRLVPLAPSVYEELQKYIQQRQDYGTPVEPSSPLLWSGRPNRIGGAFSSTGLRFNWRQICRYAGVFNNRGIPPRLHDLRHSFAVNVLQRAYDAGIDPQATLPRLARYMGHITFQFTHHYLRFTESLRISASDRFRHKLAHILKAVPNRRLSKDLTQ